MENKDKNLNKNQSPKEAPSSSSATPAETDTLGGCLFALALWGVLILAPFILLGACSMIGDNDRPRYDSRDYNRDGSVDVYDTADFLEWKSKQGN